MIARWSHGGIRTRLLALAVLQVTALALLTGCLTIRPAAEVRKLPESRTLPIEGDFRHEPSEIRLPAAIGDAQRSSVMEYDEERLDVSAFYKLLRTAPIGISVIVYPAPTVDGGTESVRRRVRARLLEEELAEVRRAVVENHPGAVLAVDGDGNPPTRRSSIRERRFVYIQSGVLRTEARLSMLDDGWWVLFRISSMAGFDDEATAALEQIADGIGWE